MNDTKESRQHVLKIYDPALCCSSGVCGPGSGARAVCRNAEICFRQPGIRVERYNLGQEPQAFVENTEVKAMLSNGGEKRLPFIFIDDQLWLQDRYPEKDELLEALGIKNKPVLSPFPAAAANGPCCGEGEC